MFRVFFLKVSGIVCELDSGIFWSNSMKFWCHMSTRFKICRRGRNTTFSFILFSGVPV